MIGRLNHVAVAVKDIAKAAKVYRDTLGAEVSGQVPQPDHGVTTVFITLPNTKIELIEPLGEGSPMASWCCFCIRKTSAELWSSWNRPRPQCKSEPHLPRIS